MDKHIFTQLSESDIRQLIREEFQIVIQQLNEKNADATPKIMPFPEGCKYVGISHSHGYKLTSQKLIPHFKRGKKIYFDRALLDQWLLSNRVPTIEEMTKETDEYLRKNKGK